jgi:hypothetical protein
VAADANRRRAILLLALPFVAAVVLVGLGFLVPALLAVGAVLAVAWGVLAAAAWRQAARVPFEQTLDLHQAVSSGALSALDTARLEDVTEGLCSALGLPVPKLRILVDPAPNAASFGRTPADAAIVLTTGVVRSVDRIGLEALLAHELSHVKRCDGLSAGVAASSACRMIDVVSGGRAGRWLTDPERELRADLAAVATTRYPPGLIDVLELGQRSAAATPGVIDPAALERTRRVWFMGAGPDAPGERLDLLYEL